MATVRNCGCHFTRAQPHEVVKIKTRKGLVIILSSRGEIKIHEILENAGFDFKEEYSFEGLNSPNGRPLRFDFVVFDDDGEIDFIIEY